MEQLSEQLCKILAIAKKSQEGVQPPPPPVGRGEQERSAIEGQFHKAKKFVITRIMFAITNISDFVSSISRYGLLIAIYKLQIF